LLIDHVVIAAAGIYVAQPCAARLKFERSAVVTHGDAQRMHADFQAIQRAASVHCAWKLPCTEW
jgi:hypothetical protein